MVFSFFRDRAPMEARPVERGPFASLRGLNFFMTGYPTVSCRNQGVAELQWRPRACAAERGAPLCPNRNRRERAWLWVYLRQIWSVRPSARPNWGTHRYTAPAIPDVAPKTRESAARCLEPQRPKQGGRSTIR